MTIARFVIAATLAASPLAAHAVTVNWADLNAATATSTSGVITVGAATVNVAIDGGKTPFAFSQINNLGTNYWTEPNPAAKPYTGGIVTNAPPTADIVALNAGGTKTITFSKAITDPYIAFVSWNGNAATFSQPFEKISEGCGYWGCGTFSLGAGNSFVGSGEVHGLLRFVGTFSTLSFTDSSEYWHGITVGIGGIAASVPEPGAVLLLGLGLAGLAAARRRK